MLGRCEKRGEPTYFPRIWQLHPKRKINGQPVRSLSEYDNDDGLITNMLNGNKYTFQRFETDDNSFYFLRNHKNGELIKHNSSTTKSKSLWNEPKLFSTLNCCKEFVYKN